MALYDIALHPSYISMHVCLHEQSSIHVPKCVMLSMAFKIEKSKKKKIIASLAK